MNNNQGRKTKGGNWPIYLWMGQPRLGFVSKGSKVKQKIVKKETGQMGRTNQMRRKTPKIKSNA